jgi:hypothetical protein
VTATNGDAWGSGIFDHYRKMLEASGITASHARARGYRSIGSGNRNLLAATKIAKAVHKSNGLLIPLRRIDGEIGGYQYRPDNPRVIDGKEQKYESEWRKPPMIDFPPGVAERFQDRGTPIWITEGVKKGDAGACAGLAVVDLAGVWNWMRDGVPLPDFRDLGLKDREIIICFDSDVAVNDGVRRAARDLGEWLKIKGAKPGYCLLPHSEGGKSGLDDYLAAGNSIDDLWKLVQPFLLPVQEAAPSATPQPPLPEPKPCTIDDALATFRRWLHVKDDAPILAVAATIAANRAPGDPVWLLVVGPPSSSKTEIISSAAGLPYIVKAATVTEAALLSGTANRERSHGATGGLLRMVGDFGILLCKDFTSVPSQNRDVAKQAMAALREVYDGSWDRPVGTDGGKVLSWAGKCGLVGGVTPSFDRYSVIVNTLGDRFLLLRLPDVDAEKQATSALRRRDHDTQMRGELAAAMTGLIHGANRDVLGRQLDDREEAALIKLATYTARARTAVERDGYSGELLVIPQAEGPARLVLGLRHLYGGLEAIGADETTRWSVVARVARDCVPSIRTKLIVELLKRTQPERTATIAAAVGMVTKTASRELDDLVLIGLATRTKNSEAANAPDMWSASEWLREFWPAESRTEKYIHAPITLEEGDEQGTDDYSPDAVDPTPSRTFLSHSQESNGDGDGDANGQTVFDFQSALNATDDDPCDYCGYELNAFQVADGVRIHPDCAEVAELEGEWS